MSRTWKWILIGLGVFILVFCVGVPLFLSFGLGMLGYGGMPMMGGQPFGRYPMMGRGFGIFGGFGLLRFLFPLFALGVVVLVIVGIVLLLRRPQKPVPVAMTPPTATPMTSTEPVPPADFASSEPVPPAVVTPAEVETTPCPHCGAPVQAGWVACPHCGEKLA